ncbi:MAG: S16 family serine protease [Actinomycetota bacterium]
MRWFRRSWVLVPVVVVGLLAGSVGLPYYSIGPGPARPVGPLIRFDERTRYGSEGSFVLTSIHYEQLTPFGILQAWLDPDLSVVSRSFLFRPGETAEEEERRATSQMDQSKLDATAVVLRELAGYPEEHGDGVLIESVFEGCAAEGELFPGDLVHAVEGTEVDDVADVRRTIRSTPSGDPLTFDVTVDGEPETVTLLRGPCADSERQLVGVSMIESFPFEVRISSGSIGGPSAGLAWALGLYDLLTPGDLSGGRTIAVTGQVGVDGTVFPIGAPDEKVAAAAGAGATVLILPADNLAEARSIGDRGVELVPVASFDEALAYLQGTG